MSQNRPIRHGEITGPAGFTLMELMVVIILITIMFALVVPKLDLTGGVGNLEKAVRMITAQLEARKNEAVSERKTRYLVFDLDSQKMGREEETKTEDGESETRVKLSPLPNGITFAQVETKKEGSVRQGRVRIRISKEGYVEQAAVQISDNSRKLTLFFEPFLGSIRQVDGFCDLESQKA